MRAVHVSKLVLIAIGMAGLVATASCLELTTSNEGEGGGAPSNPTTSGSSSSGGKPCSTDADCPSLSECATRGCESGECATTSLTPAGTACTPGVVCDGMGICVDCVVDSDCQVPATCMQNMCVSCVDGLKNGDETGIDCGGQDCQTCAGDACSNSNDCLSGYCVDGVCCSASCIGVCMTCNATGNAGDCINVPAGQEDPGTCGATKACTVDGSCLLKNGQACMTNTNCVSNKCASGVCMP